jgi:hypothetical protein
MRRTFSRSLVAIAAATALSSEARAQSAPDELRCALLGPERASSCLRAVAERVGERDLERAVSLFVRVGDVEVAEQQVERAFASGERSRVWPAMLAIGRARRERREHRASLDWYERWRDRAKRDATPDVLAEVHAGAGHALRALDAPRAAYDSYRLAVHVWRAEHAYKFDVDGEVRNESEGQPGYVAPGLLSSGQFVTALRLARPGVLEDELWQCIERSDGHEGALRRCVRALRPLREPCNTMPGPPGPSGGPSGIVFPFGALTPRESQRPRAHRTRSRLGDEAFQRGNSAAGHALLGMAQLIREELVRIPVPVYRGASTAAAFDAWTRTALIPLITHWRQTLESALVPMAQQAIATGVPDPELGGAQALASAYYDFARFIRACPRRPEWWQPVGIDECGRPQY